MKYKSEDFAHVGATEDALGRPYSDIVGFGSPRDTVRLPIGSVVRLEAPWGRPSPLQKLWVGTIGVVVGQVPGAQHITMYDSVDVRVRALTPKSQFESIGNHVTWPERHAQVLVVGDGSAPEAGVHFEESDWERAHRISAERDHRMQGFTNPPTHLAFLYLNQEPRVHDLLQRHRLRNGAVSGARVAKIYYDGVKAGQVSEIDDWAWYPEGLRHYDDLRYSVNWDEIAGQFSQKLKEADAYAEAH